MIWLLSAFLVFAQAKSKSHSAKSSAPLRSHLTKVASCAAEGGKKVLIVKQWHLSPTTVTKGFKEKYPQERNQAAIYSDLAERVKRGQLQVVVAEGCANSEIGSGFKTEFNGWDYENLRRASLGKGYDKVLSHVPLKLEARFEDKVMTVCGDSDEQIKEGLIRLSNLRGWAGFWSRLNATYPDDKLRLFSDAAADTLKVPRTTPTPELLKMIKGRMKDDLAAFQQTLKERNTAFVKVLQAQNFSTAAVVIGGLHAEDLKAQVDAAGMACEVLEPPGYQPENERLIGDFATLLNK